VVAAGLILTLIALGRRITGRAREVDALLQRTRDNTGVLFDLPETNRALNSIGETLGKIRAGAQ
jgi:hypothetical protein